MLVTKMVINISLKRGRIYVFPATNQISDILKAWFGGHSPAVFMNDLGISSYICGVLSKGLP
jgi:hypothetical protein